jgi:hypothetical protein
LQTQKAALSWMKEEMDVGCDVEMYLEGNKGKREIGGYN